MLGLLLLGLGGCDSVDTAPEDLDGVAHWFWTRYDEGTDKEMALALQNLQRATEDIANPMTEPYTGQVEDLTKDERTVEVEHGLDPTKATGMLMVAPVGCALGSMEEMFLATDQTVVLPDTYTSYTRTLTSSEDDYTRRQSSTLTWEGTVVGKALGSSYTQPLLGGIRYIADQEDEEVSPYGAFFVSRNWMPDVGSFDDEEKSFSQDYQLDVVWVPEAGEARWMSIAWRQMSLGSGLDTDGDLLISTTLSTMEGWAEKRTENCEAGRF